MAVMFLYLSYHLAILTALLSSSLHSCLFFLRRISINQCTSPKGQAKLWLFDDRVAYTHTTLTLNFLFFIQLPVGLLHKCIYSRLTSELLRAFHLVVDCRSVCFSVAHTSITTLESSIPMDILCTCRYIEEKINKEKNFHDVVSTYLYVFNVLNIQTNVMEVFFETSKSKKNFINE